MVFAWSYHIYIWYLIVYSYTGTTLERVLVLLRVSASTVWVLAQPSQESLNLLCRALICWYTVLEKYCKNMLANSRCWKTEARVAQNHFDRHEQAGMKPRSFPPPDKQYIPAQRTDLRTKMCTYLALYSHTLNTQLSRSSQKRTNQNPESLGAWSGGSDPPGRRSSLGAIIFGEPRDGFRHNSANMKNQKSCRLVRPQERRERTGLEVDQD